MSSPMDDQVELFKVKKLIKSLQAARGYVTLKICCSCCWVAAREIPPLCVLPPFP